MNRPFIVGGIGLLVLGAALAWNYFASVETEAPVAEAPATQAPSEPSQPPASDTPETAQPDEKPAPEQPTQQAEAEQAPATPSAQPATSTTADAQPPAQQDAGQQEPAQKETAQQETAEQEPMQQEAAQPSDEPASAPADKPAETAVAASQPTTPKAPADMSAEPKAEASEAAPQMPATTTEKPATKPMQSAARTPSTSQPQETAQETAAATTAPPKPKPSRDQESAEPPAQQTAAATARTEPSPPPLAEPTFDVVRVNPDGNAVIAGRAPPGSEVVIHDGEREIGRVTADARGEWVFLPSEPLPPGMRELGLRARLGDRESRSQQLVMLAVPEPKKDIAGQPSESESGALALMVERDSATPSRVLQRPSDTAKKSATADREPEAKAKAEAKPSAPPAPAMEKPADVAASATAQPEKPMAAASQAETQPQREAAPESAPRQTATAEPEAKPQPQRTAAVARQPAQPPAPVSPVPGTPDISIELISYGAEGQLNISGRAQPGATLFVYLDNRLIGRAEVDRDGGWHLKPQDPIEAGLYKLRVDHVEEAAGKVVARAEMPFERANIPSGRRLLDDETWIVQPGNSLWRIARRKYGTGFRYWDIFEANAAQIRDPDLIYPGQVFSIPTVN